MIRFTAAAIALVWTASASDGNAAPPQRRAAAAADERRAHHPLLQDGARHRSAAHTRPFGLGGPPRRPLRAQRRLDLGRGLIKIAIGGSDLTNVRFGPLCGPKSGISRGQRSAISGREQRGKRRVQVAYSITLSDEHAVLLDHFVGARK
jgi:hypothetical protein